MSLCPCPWPRAFLFLASRGSVLGKAVLGLGLFLCPCTWPWPQDCFLDSTSGGQVDTTWQLNSKTERFLLLSPGQSNLVSTSKLQKLTYRPLMGTRGWFQRFGSSSFEFLLVEGDSVERSDRNVLQGTFCLQLSPVFQFYCYIPFTE